MIDLYLDDMRKCPKGFVLAKNAEECVELLRECEVRVLSLDFDLGWGAPNGMEVVRFLVVEQKYPAYIYLHSSSAAGRSAMYHMLYTNKPDHVRLFNHPMPEELLRLIASGKFEVENGSAHKLQ
ncbi:cyclic-phosphate processing receiver domain-containing protein [Paenibacillus sp. GCM10012303]|uniref:cyclic-phosphate processing receiver domain-containing protein n=1 Tax=Paenibacillus sp. GCM10012303 TaxID=3317340 RepID=UPI00361CCACD